jgi:hypothetical protein
MRPAPPLGKFFDLPWRPFGSVFGQVFLSPFSGGVF